MKYGKSAWYDSQKGAPMTDYTSMPLGPFREDYIGEIVECPYCHRHALKVEDYKQVSPFKHEEETIYVHSERLVPTSEGDELRATDACPARIKPKSRAENPLE
jgi:hypothetical protein